MRGERERERERKKRAREQSRVEKKDDQMTRSKSGGKETRRRERESGEERW